MAMSLKPSNPASTSPSWEVLTLVAAHLDPKTLAIASCVSTSWFDCMSSDHHWKPFCSTQYPSLFSLRVTDRASSVSYRRIYALGYTASRRRLRNPIKPCLSLQNLIFTVDVQNLLHGYIATASISGEDLKLDPNGLFRFEIDAGNNFSKATKGFEWIKLRWNIMLKEWNGVFCMMECENSALNLVAGTEGWYGEPLPPPGCCSKEIKSGLMGEMKIRFGSAGDESDEMMRVDRVSVGVWNNVQDWRYITVDDGLRYLQHFLHV